MSGKEVAFLSGEVVEVTGLQDGAKVGDLLRRLMEVRPAPGNAVYQLVSAEGRALSSEEVLEGDSFTAVAEKASCEIIMLY